MKKTVNSLLSLLLVFALLACLMACGGKENPWDDAIYTVDTELGTGAKTLTVEVEAEGKTITLTVHTDKETVGAALIEHGLLAGEDSQYGLYVKRVNGMLADYDKNQYYWAFYIDGEYAMTGVDGTAIDESAVYRLAYTKG